MRVTAIEIENFKGISDRVRVELKPITLLFGANSAGKSTILHALLYMKDVLDRRNLDAIRTPVSGKALDLGGFRSFVHGQDVSRIIRIWVHMDLTEGDLGELAPQYKLPSILSDMADKRIPELLQKTSEVLQSVYAATVGIEVKWDETAKCPVASAYTVELNKRRFVRIERGKSHVKIERKQREIDGEEAENDQEVFELPEDVLPRFDERRYLEFQGMKNWLRTRQDPIPDLSERETLSLPDPEWESEESRANYGFEQDYIAVAKMRNWEGTHLLARLVIGPGKRLQEWLQMLRYIGPLRSRPPRKGIPSEDLGDWAEGLAAWKALEEEGASPNLIDEVSQWLAGRDRLNSGYTLLRRPLATVDREAFRSAIAGDADKTQLLELLDEASKTTEIKLVESRSRLELDPSDVGVGVSQVLPIVVGAVLPGGSVVAIEQPELHIHPAMQVALGDLFIEGATKRGMIFLIETHSEHLMLRLLRRIRETSDGELVLGLPEVKPEDISVLYVDKAAGGMRISSLPIDDSGEFTERWPRGFFVERGEELF